MIYFVRDDLLAAIKLYTSSHSQSIRKDKLQSQEFIKNILHKASLVFFIDRFSEQEIILHFSMLCVCSCYNSNKNHINNMLL